MQTLTWFITFTWIGTLPQQTTGANVSPSVAPTKCVDTVKWSSWINRNTPSIDTDEKELMTATEMKAFCSGKLIDVECKTITDIPSYSAGDVGTTCTIANGLTCSGSDNFPIGCQDYMIRYQCQERICGVTQPSISLSGPVGPRLVSSQNHTNHSGVDITTKKQDSVSGFITTTTTTTTTTTVPLICETLKKWSMWIDRQTPTTVNGSDIEGMTPTERHRFCGSGKITAAQCETVDGVPYDQTEDTKVCDIEKGLTCDEMQNFPIGCLDYRVRFQCETCKKTTPPDVVMISSITSTNLISTYSAERHQTPNNAIIVKRTMPLTMVALFFYVLIE